MAAALKEAIVRHDEGSLRAGVGRCKPLSVTMATNCIDRGLG